MMELVTDFTSMPSQEMVEELYASVLEAQLIPTNVRVALQKSQSVDKKWATIKAYKEMMGNASMTENSSYGSNDKELLNILKSSTKRPDINILLSLKTRMTTANKVWMEEFIAAQGIPTLLSAMESRLLQYPLGELDAAILYELIACTKTILNNGWTIDIFLSSKRAIRIITQSLLFEFKPLAIQVLEILSVICNYSQGAAAVIVRHFRSTSKSRREAAFTFLVDAILNEDVDVKAAIVLLLNQIFASIDDLTGRMVIRNELKAIRCGVICESIIAELEREEASRLQTADYGEVAALDFARPYTKKTSRRSAKCEQEDVPLSIGSAASDDAIVIENVDSATIEADISPSHGVMSGLCLSGKNVSSMGGSLLKELGSKATKYRWYVLNKETLTWWGKDKRHLPAKGQLSTSDILHVRPYTRNAELLTATNYTFEIETPSRVYTFACTSETDKDNWVTALTVARDNAILNKCSYSLSNPQQNVITNEAFSSHLLQFRKQVAVYYAIAQEDHEQSISYHNTNVTDPSDMLQFIQHEMALSGQSQTLISVLQEMIAIPADTKHGEFYWGKILQTCRELRQFIAQNDGGYSSTIHHADKCMAYPSLDTDSCLRILKTKEHTNTGRAVSEMSRITMELHTKQIEINRIRGELKAYQQNGSLAKVSATIPERVAAIPNNPTSSATGTLVDFPTSPPTAPHQSTALARAVRGSARPILAAPPLPGPVPGMVLPPRLGADGLLVLPRKASSYDYRGPRPQRKMKSLFWNKSTMSESGIWKSVRDCSPDDLGIDFFELENKFSIASGPAGEKATEKRTRITKPKLISMLETKRSQMMEISFGIFKIPPQALPEMVVQLDPDALTLEKTDVILESLLPSEIEVKLVRGYSGDTNTLAKADCIVAALSTIPRLERRLQCHKLVFVWDGVVDQHLARLSILSEFCQEVTSAATNKKLTHLFAIILAAGNFLNADSARVCGAVELESLMNLTTIKRDGQNGRETLLHFIIAEVRRKDPSILELWEHLKSVHPAASVNFSNLKKEILRSCDELKKAENEIELGMANLPSDSPLVVQLKHRLDHFLGNAKSRVSDITNNLNMTSIHAASCLDMFNLQLAMNEDNDPLQKFCHTMAEFLLACAKCLRDIESWHDEDVKRERRVAAARFVRRMSVTDGESDDDSSKDKEEAVVNEVLEKENLFNRFRDAQAANTQDLIKEMKQKMLQRQKLKRKSIVVEN